MKKIGIVFLVFVLVVLVWLLKNASKVEENPTSSSEESVISAEELEDVFSLDIQSPFDLEKLKSYHLPIVIDFGADWCPPCKQMKPNYQKLYQTYRGKAIIQYADVDEYPELAEIFPMQYIPTQTFFNKDGTPYAPQNAKELGLDFYYDHDKNHVLTMHVGGLSFEQMEQMLKEMGLDG